MSVVRVLRTRLLPPRLPPDSVPRPRLMEVVRRGLRGRLVAIVAGAGYGKTTLLAQVVAGERRPWAWCSCDPRLADSATLLAHVAAAIAMRFPGFDARLDLTGTPEEAVADLSNELLDTVAEEIVLILDDVHALPAPASIAVGLLAEALPDSVHMALAGRLPLPLPLRRLGAGRLVEVGESELGLTPDEASAVLASVASELTAEERAEIFRRTEGWPAGVVLVGQVGLTAVSAPDALHFEYLAHEVIGAQDERLQRFLLGTAAFGRFSPALAEAVTGMTDAAELARSLVRRHLFTVRLDAEGEWFRYHHLFRGALLRRAEEEDPAALRQQHLLAARWWLSVAEPMEGVRHLLEAGDHAAAVDALEPIAEEMLSTENAETLARWLDEIPRPLWRGRARLLLAHAALLLTRADHEASFADYEAAIEDLILRGDHERAAAALVRMQQDMIAAGTSPETRIELAGRWLALLDPAARMTPVARVLLATSYGYACRFDEAEREIAAVRRASGNEFIALTADVAESFYVRFWRGSPVEALSQLDDAIERLGTDPSSDPLGLRLTALALRMYLLNELGRHAEAHRGSEEIVELMARQGWGRRAIRRSGDWVILTALAGLGRWEEVRARREPPPRAAADSRAISYSYRYRVIEALLAAHDGDAGGVRDAISAVRRGMAAFGTAFDDGSFLADLAHAASLCGLHDIARTQAHDALSAAREIDSPWLQGRAALALAEVDIESPTCEAALHRALELTVEHRLEPLWTHRAGLAAAQALLRALEHGLGPPEGVERALAACSADVLTEVLRLSRTSDPAVRVRLAGLVGESRGASIRLVDGLLRDPAQPVREAARVAWGRLRARPRAAIQILSLGRLVVLRDGSEVPVAAYARPRARALLAAVLASGGSAHRERLCEELWPDLRRDRGAAALRTTLHDLRRAIEPELDAGDPSSLLVADSDWVRLSFTERDAWDAATLRRLAAARVDESLRERLARLREAATLCQGDFLAEWPYEEWAIAPRQELAALQDGLLSAFADAQSEAGHHAEAVRLLERLVARDPQREGRQRALMRAYSAAGDRAMALRQYHACRTILRREQGVEPDAKTRALYLSILAEEEPAAAPAGGVGDATVTIVFTDIEGSTEIAERLGDLRWAQVLAEHDRVIRRHAEAHGGREVKSQGDGVMLTFPSARRALEFAVAVQRDMATEVADEPLRVRIGLHTGEAVRRGDDLLGRAVITAARIVAECRGGEIALSGLVRRLVEGAGDLEFDEGREVRLKGMREPERLYRLRWSPVTPA